MSRVVDYFLQYVQMDTQSDEESRSVPSTAKQLELGRLLEKQLKELGASDVRLDEKGYVYAKIPATCPERLPVLGFIAHMDTSPAVSGANVRPRIVSGYDGGEIVLNAEKKIVLSPREYPCLKGCEGLDLIVTDGRTLLGADDKAGVAEIMAMAAVLLENPAIRHGEIRIAFTPDEEIGSGADYFDVAGFGADFAYTVDGGELGELEFENFNAAAATVTLSGVSIHPGSAKGLMKNALLTAMEFHAMLPPAETPAHTEGYEGFYHLDAMSGGVERTELRYIIRDHDADRFNGRKQTMRRIAAYLNEKYGAGTVELEITDSYYNMKEKILPHFHLVENALRAMRELDIEPKIRPIRGGTDGARLSYEGLPCPNLCTGGFNFHGRYEFIPVQSMEKTVALLLRIAGIYGDAATGIQAQFAQDLERIREAAD